MLNFGANFRHRQNSVTFQRTCDVTILCFLLSSFRERILNKRFPFLLSACISPTFLVMGLLNLNKCCAKQLVDKAKIEQSLADSIVRYRTCRNGFHIFEELWKITGMDRASFRSLKKCFHVPGNLLEVFLVFITHHWSRNGNASVQLLIQFIVQKD